MALEEDLKVIQKELNAQEKMIETFIKGERFLRKYKYFFLTIIVLIVAYFSYVSIAQTLAENKIKNNNELYAKLLQDPQNNELLDRLKAENPNLYALFIFSNDGNFTAQLEELKNLELDPILKQLIAADTTPSTDGVFLKHFNMLLQAYNLLKEDKIKEANVLLNQIPIDSSLRPLVDNFKHYKAIK